MSHNHGTLFYIDHSGTYENLNSLSLDTVFVPDANVSIKIIEKSSDPQILDFLRHLREVRNKYKFPRNNGMPVDISMSALEISKQHKKQKYKKFLSKFDQIFIEIFPQEKYDQIWLQKKHRSGLNAVLYQINSLEETIRKIHTLVPEKRINNHEILDRCKNLISWTWSKRDSLSMIGGPILYQGIYAISGSPEANRVLKINRMKKSPEETVTNVAWDFLYWIYLEFEYLFESSPNTAICTYDKDLALLLSQRINRGPRHHTSILESTDSLRSFGELNGYDLARLEDTNLANEISSLLLDFWRRLDAVSTDSIRVGFQSIRENRAIK